MSAVPPNQTVYVANLNENVNKQELRRSLYSLYSQYGRIMDVVALKTRKMRGQAFVVFSELNSATAAMRSMNGFAFYGRPMRVGYAKSKSHVVMKEDGTFGKTEKKKEGKKAKGPTTAAPQTVADPGIAVTKNLNPHVSTAPAVGAPADTAEQPQNNILFLGNLPDETSEMMISMLFKELAGFKEVRLIDGRPDIAFVEYDTEDQAAVAKDTLHGFKLTPQLSMTVAFAKK